MAHQTIPQVLVQAVHAKFGTSLDRWEPLSGGMSGMPLFRFFIASDSWVVRSWPATSENENKIRLWSEQAKFLESRKEALLPRFESCPIPCPVSWNISDDQVELTIEEDSRWWTLVKWLPGSPLRSTQISEEQRTEYVRQLAHLHRVSRAAGVQSGSSRGVQERADLLDRILVEIPTMERLRSDPLLGIRIAPFLEILQSNSGRWRETINKLSTTKLELHWIIRDLWKENLLVDQNEKWIHTVDVGASRIDWPGFDFIRLVGSLPVADCSLRVDDTWQGLADTYLEVNPHSSLCSGTDLRSLHEAATAISIAYWCRRIHEQASDSSQHSRYVLRLLDLLQIFLKG
ncbi:phosphotransferase [Pirellulaceae bacterium SH449]